MFVTRRLAQMTRGGIAGFLAVVVLAGVAVFFWVARAINTAPAQCATCHPDLTAMWQRSQGHPSDRVTCYQCHAQHAELPHSLNVGAFVRDEIIPEKYLSGDDRIQERCEGCHPEMRTSGTGREFAAAKSSMLEALAVVPQLEDRDRRIPFAPQDLQLEDGSVQATVLLAAGSHALRDHEWRSGLQAADIGEDVAALGADLESAARALKDAKPSEGLLMQRLEEHASQEQVANREHVAASLERIRAAIEAAVRTLGAVAADLPQTVAAQPGTVLTILSASVRTLPGAVPQPAVAPPAGGQPPAGPSDLAVAATRSLESLGEAVAGSGGLRYADLGLDDQQVGVLTERLRNLAVALAGGDGPARARARVQVLLGTALAELPGAEAEDRLVLKVAVESIPSGGSVSFDLDALLAAAATAFREHELAGQRQKVVQVNHKLHLVSARDGQGQPLGLGCLSCHRNIAHDKAQVETNRPTMAGCFTAECHRRDRNKDNCRRCHYQQLTEPGQEVL
jgi:hypothetical protein